MKNHVLFFLFLSIAAATQSSGQTLEEIRSSAKDSLYLFSYFVKEDQGLQLALSADGYNWVALNDGKPIFKPGVGDSLLRDPSIIYDEEREIFHMVWTTSWRNPGFGYSNSLDLVNWTDQKFISVKRGILNTDSLINAWAPELFYDIFKDEYLVIWASATFTTWVPGWYFQGVNQQYYMRTKDFETFSEPTSLFGNSFYGWMHIDTYIRYANGQYYFFPKFYSQVGEGQHNAICWVKAPALDGPFTHPPQQIPGAVGGKKEAACVIRVDDNWIMYYDTPPGAAISKDLENWENITGLVKYPEGWRHGTAIKVKVELLERIIEQSL